MSSSGLTYPLEGGCDCETIRYRMEASPLIVHCCHCTWCQRETGTAFVLNAVVETCNVTLLSPTKPLMVPTPSASGRGQTIARCPKCYVALWSHYGGMGELGSFIRVGTLDKRDLIKPDVHIFTSSKMEWIDLSSGLWEGKVFEKFYDHAQVWSKDSLERMAKIMQK